MQCDFVPSALCPIFEMYKIRTDWYPLIAFKMYTQKQEKAALNISPLNCKLIEELNHPHLRPLNCDIRRIVFVKVRSVLDAEWGGLAGVSQCSGQKPFRSHDEGSPPQELAT